MTLENLIARRHSSRRGRTRPLASSFRTAYQQRAFRFERAELLRIAKPPAGIGCWRWRWIHDSFVHHICESRVSKQLRPLVAGKQDSQMWRSEEHTSELQSR